MDQVFNPIQDGQKAPLPKICHDDETWHSYTLPQEDQKNIWTRDTPPEFCWHQHFSPGNQQILLYQEIQIHIAFWYIISNSFNFSLKSLKIFLINMIIILIMSTKMATQGLLKATVFFKKGHGIIIPVHDVTIKILSRDLNYIIDVVIRPNLVTLAFLWEKLS